MADCVNDAAVVEYFYALASPWSYLGNDKLRAITQRHGVHVEPYIIDYDRMFDAAATVPLPRRPPLRKAYRLIELRRWSAYRKVPLNAQPRFYRGEVEEPDEHAAALLVQAAKLSGLDSWRLAHALSRALWAEERFPFMVEEMRSICGAQGFDYDMLTTAQMMARADAAYQAATDYAIERRVFGMPFYIYQNQPYWGQDRLELLEHALHDQGLSA